MKISNPEVQELNRRWKHEHQNLLRYMDETRQWVKQVSQRGIPKFGEMAQRLVELRDHLVKHFDCENEIGERCAAITQGTSQAVTATRRQSHHDHPLLLGRVDTMVNELRELEPPFESWTQAIERMERIIDEIDFHEEQEAESLDCLCSLEDEDLDKPGV